MKPQTRAVAAMMSGRRTYIDKIKSYSPIAYWPLHEVTGTVARCQINPAQNGAYLSGTLVGNAAGPDTNPSPWLDGINDSISIYTTTFRDALNGSQGSMMVWAKVNSVANWTDGTTRNIFYLHDGGYNNLMAFRKLNTNNDLRWLYYAGGVAEEKTLGGNTDTGWMCLVLTWNKAGDAIIGYKNGNPVVNSDTLGVWGGPISVARIGSDAASGFWHGWLAHGAVWNRVLTPTEISDLATA